MIDLLQTSPDGAIHLSFNGRTYRIMGLSPTGIDRLRVNLRLSVNSSFHIDSLDLYQARGRDAFAQRAAKQTGFAESEIAQDLLEMIEPLEAARLSMRKEGEKPKPTMTQQEKDEALVSLRSPNLIEQVVSDITACGFIGEADTVLTAYLAATSRKLSKPLSVLVIARSGAGKSSLQDAIVGLMPSEDVVKVTRLTGQALYYKGPDTLKHKLLSIAEVEGASKAEYSLRTLISDQYLSVEATQADPKTGKLGTIHHEIYGPLSVLISTTSPEAFAEETRNRFMQATMNESVAQTEAILEQQRNRHTLEGAEQETQIEKIRKRHQDMQRLIRPLRVINPYMKQLRYPNDRLISRREQEKYLTLIDTIALLHQHQRPIKRMGQGDEYVEVVKADIGIANRVAQAILWRSSAEVGITRREIQKVTGWSFWQVRTYCGKL